MRALVSVRTDHDHVPPSLQREKSNRIAGGQTSVKACCQAPIKSRPRSSAGGRRQNSFRSDLCVDATLWSQPAAAESQPVRSDRPPNRAGR
jgi:hypothetical protein